MQSGARVIIEDVTESDIFRGHPSLEAVLAAGVRAVQSMPLVSSTGKLLGMVSTHFGEPAHLGERDLSLMDLLARQAADYLERKQAEDSEKRAEQALRQSELRWRTMAEALPNLLWTGLPDGQCDWLSSQWGKYIGIPEQELLGFNWLERVIHPDDRERTAAAWKAACADRADYDLEYRIRRYDGEYRWFKTRGVPIRDERNKIIYWFGTCTDIEDIRQAEQRERILIDQAHVLMREVNHRAKNMLSLVQAIARQTAASDNKDFLVRFDERVQALAASQDLLVRSGWKNVPLEGLVRAQLAHFQDLLDRRIVLRGPSVDVTAAAAQTIGMALHELATNASKYGALAIGSGHVDITWSIERPHGGKPRFSICWTESEGPLVIAPNRRGFGSTVLEDLAKMSLNAETSLNFSPSGLVWRLSCMASQIVEGGSKSIMPARPSEVSRPDSGRARILVVEDEVLAALEIAAQLTDAGFEVIGPAGSVAQALNLLNECARYDAAVLDVNLGHETSEPIAQVLSASSKPFITISGYAREQLPSVFDAAPFLAKPLRQGVLVPELKRCLADASASSPLQPLWWGKVHTAAQ
jgi:PAS domain S-box-containing protein